MTTMSVLFCFRLRSTIPSPYRLMALSTLLMLLVMLPGATKAFVRSPASTLLLRRADSYSPSFRCPCAPMRTAATERKNSQEPLEEAFQEAASTSDLGSGGNSQAPASKTFPLSDTTQLDALRQENKALRAENDALHSAVAKGLVLESFEGNQDDMWCDELQGDSCPIEPAITFGEALRDRAAWLVGLLVLQSASGLILAHNEALLVRHPVIVYFLTMLVGAGGNAGNQASVRVIRGLALGTLNSQTQSQFLNREIKMAMALSTMLSVAGFVRAAVFRTPLPETLAVTIALFLIVFTSVCFGAVLPLGLKGVGVDPAHSSTSIQVIMDILGVLLTVVVSTAILDTPLGGMIVERLSGS